MFHKSFWISEEAYKGMQQAAAAQGLPVATFMRHFFTETFTAPTGREIIESATKERQENK